MKQNEIFGNAKFVKAGNDCISPRFRGKFNAAKGEKTEITVCGLGFFRLYINGKRPDDSFLAPVFSFYHDYDGLYCRNKYSEQLASRIYCMKYDITELVRDGVNSVCAEVGPGWYPEFDGDCVLCYKIECGGKTYISDKSIKWNDSPITFYEYRCGEKQDYTKPCLDENWINPDFDDTEWKNAAETEMPETEYFIQDCPNDKIIRSIDPVLIGETEETLIYDAGENITGTCVFGCAEKGKCVRVTCSEEIDGNNRLHEKWIHGQNAEFITDASPREYGLMFTWHAFRYFEITKGVQNVRVDVIHCDAPVISDFKSENKVLNWLFDAFVRTQLANMHTGIPSDCPHLERRGYTGDGQIACESVMLLLESKKFYLKWMEDIADCQDRISGNVQYTAPYKCSGGGPGGWGCAIAEVPYKFYKMYGDAEPMKKYFDGMLAYVDYLEAHSENDLVTSGQPGLWCLGDWCAPHEVHGEKPLIPEPFVNTFFFIRMLDRMTELADIIGRGDKKAMLLEKREKKVRAIYDSFFDEKTGSFAGGINGADAFALEIGLGDERTVRNLAEKYRSNPVDTGMFGTDYVTGQLFAKGFFDEAVDYLSGEEYPSFGFMMNSGATTLWEEWKNPRSMSHPMLGSAAKYLIYYVLGIRSAKEGFGKIIIEPKTNEKTGNVSGFIDLPAGRVSVSVDRQRNECVVSVPDGTECDIVFDGTIRRI